jgi:hypothetical protein
MIDIGFSYYFFGSEDSMDIDVMVDHPEAGSKESDSQIIKFLKQQYPEIKEWNINIISIQNGEVIHSIPNKGGADSANNSLFQTYHKHVQVYDLPLKGTVPRNIPLACVKCVNSTLLWFKASKLDLEYRQNIRPAMVSGDWAKCIDQLLKLSFRPPFNDNDKENKNILKSLAFNIGQTVALLKGRELYTKQSLGAFFPELIPLLQRRDCDADFILRHKLQELHGLFLNETIQQLEPFKLHWRGEYIDIKTGKVI